nr:GyrI-like domain-containing protein [uncultured Dongia sp.]
MKQATTLDYGRRVEKVIRHMGAHLDDALDLDALAEIACLSPYHFHRIYAGMTGETAAESLRRLRLHRAASDLLDGTMPLPRVATRAGYGSVAAFGRAFQSSYGVAPAAYRKRGFLVADYADHLPASRSLKPEHAMFNVTIRDTQAIRLAALRHVGHYLEIGPVFARLYAWAGPRGLMSATTRGLGIYYSDTKSSPPAEWRSDACISIGPDVAIDAQIDAGAEDGPRLIDLAGGRHAVLRHQGPYAELHKAYDWLFGTWLPQSGEEPADRPCFEEYLNNPRDLPPEEWLTEISLPLVAR